MKKSLIICDLCGAPNENEMSSISRGKQNLDICITCFEKISPFYNAKKDFVERFKDERIPKVVLPVDPVL